MIGTHRGAPSEEINERLDLALNCFVEATDEACSPFNFVKDEYLNKTEISQLRYVLVQK
jgi:hypothetical protein